MAIKRGTARSDVIYGTSQMDTLYGLAGHDRLYGYGANDILYGDIGNDTLDGGSGNDRLFGGSNNDRLSGGSSIDLLDGGTGHDILIGGTQDDAVYGRNGNDTFYGDNGSNLDGNFYDGGADVDLLTFQSATRAVDAYLGYRSGLVVSDTDDEIVRIENLTGSRFSDTLTGSLTANVIRGLDGRDLVYGSGGADTLHGDAGNDSLYGDNWRTIYDQSPGNDTLYGGAGNDVLYGGGGTDRLYGGADSDTFVIQQSESNAGFYGDTVMDFVSGIDKIGLQKLPSVFTDGVQFMGTGAFNSNGYTQVRYTYIANSTESGVDTLVQVDFDDTLGADAQIRLLGQHTFTSSDFVFV